MSSTMDITITDTIRAIWIDRPAHTSSEWMTLRQVRETIAAYEDVTWTREEVDEALADLMVSRQARIIPESNQKTLTEADRAAALVLAGKSRHLITFAK